MRLVLMGVGAVVAGVVVGSFAGGTQVKDRILQQVEAARADSIAAEREVEAARIAAEDAELQRLEVQTAATDPSPPAGDPAADSSAAAAEAARLAEQQRVTDSIAAAEAAAQLAAAESARLAEEGAQKLSRIFGAMRAQDAAAVLQEMSNAEIEVILQHMNERLAAEILGGFEPSRAAQLSRVVLGSRENRP